jgi:hypothetical protein
MGLPAKIFAVLFISDLSFLAVFLLLSNLTLTNFSVVQLLFDPDGEANLFSWYSSSKFALIAFLFLLVFAFSSGSRYSSILIAAVALAISADEAAMLHERIGYEFSVLKRGVEGATPGDWPRVYALPTFFAGGTALYWAVRSGAYDRCSRKLLFLGLAIFVVGALGMELIGGLTTWLDDHVGISSTRVIVVAEEALENLGATILVAAGVRIVLLHTRLNDRYRAAFGEAPKRGVMLDRD